MIWTGRGRAATGRAPAVPLGWGGVEGVAALGARARYALARAFAAEVEERRLFLWLPVFAGIGVVAYFSAVHEPWVWAAPLAALSAGALARLVENHRAARLLLIALAAVAAGFASAQWRAQRVAAPMLDRIRIAQLTGTIEEMDIRRQGARFLLRVASLDDWGPERLPVRVRLSMRDPPLVKAGDFVALKARLLPPARAALPGGYDFARDAFFARIGAVGSTLGRIEILPAPEPPDFPLWAMAQIDHVRNALAARIDETVGGDAGAIAVAMITGKRDRLSEGTRELIRAAGIFHIITISGIQMTLVAGILFWIFRRLLGASRSLALRYPIKKWAAVAAILGALLYDIGTGSRVGTERALFMTLIVFTAILFDRQALTMRNLALAALAVIVLEPEAILGASFQLSFAAVAALVAVYEARQRAFEQDRNGLNQEFRLAAERAEMTRKKAAGPSWRETLASFMRHTRHGVGGVLFATLCATSATAPFMAYHFHELSPYVLVGNPLTLGIIEFFAVPGALLGAALYPFGLDALVWRYVGLGIDLVLWAARLIAAAPGADLHVLAFAPWAIGFLALFILSTVIWRSWPMRAAALPLLALGFVGAGQGHQFDLVVPPSGDAVAYRGAEGKLYLLGKRPNLFAAEQWLRADGDGRRPQSALGGRCDALGCAAALRGGGSIALVLAPEAFQEDCLRAEVIVTPLAAPSWCAAPVVLDRFSLRASGAVALQRYSNAQDYRLTAREPGEDRPWSPAPAARNALFHRKAKPAAPALAMVETDIAIDPAFH